MAEEKKVAEVKEETITVSKAEYDSLVSERAKLAEAVNKLINTLANQYAQNVYKEVLGD